MVILLNRVSSVKLGNSSATGDHVELTNVKRAWHNPMPAEYNPAIVLNYTNPIGWHKPHKWLKGEIHCTSEAYTAFYNNPLVAGGTKAYIVPNGENVIMPYAVITNLDELNRAWTYTYTGFIPVDDAGDIDSGKDEVVRVYPFQAYYCTITPPSGYPP